MYYCFILHVRYNWAKFECMKSLSLYFSPTGGGAKIAHAIKQSIDGQECESQYSLNLNKKSISEEDGEVPDMPVIFTVPVYGGHMPKIAMERFDNVRSLTGQPAILVVVYGNRAFENALTDLEAFVKDRGFNPVAAAAFSCEHTYSDSDTPIAVGRPDEEDLQAAMEFGRLVRGKLMKGYHSPINTSDLKDEPSSEESVKNFIAFVREYQARQANAPKTYLPILDSSRCVSCGECRDVCPTSAIFEDFTVDAARCIKCCACVKSCPTGARTFFSPFASVLSRNFSERKSPHWIL